MKRQYSTLKVNVGTVKKVHRGNSLAMIAQKGQPTLRGLGALGRPSHPAGDSGFRNLEAEHEKFTMDARRTPMWILCDHLEGQLTDLSGDSPATADSFSHLAEHGPIQFEFQPGATERQFPAGRETAPPSVETRSGTRAPKTTYRVAPASA